MDPTNEGGAVELAGGAPAGFGVTFEPAAVGVAHVGLDGRWLRVNSRLCEIVGYSREELLARSFQEITHPDDLAADVARAEALLAGRIDHYTMEKRYVRRDGRLVWVELTMSLLRSAAGGARYFIAVVQSIDARKLADERLGRRTRSVQLLARSATRLLVEGAGERLIVDLLREVAQHLESEVFLYYRVAPSGCELVLEASAGVGEELRERASRLEFGQAVCGGVAQRGIGVALSDACLSDDPRHGLLRELGVRAYASQPLLAAGRVVGTLSFGSRTRSQFEPEELDLLHGICDQMAMALEQRRLRDELEARARELASANSAKDQFLAVLSHELRTPLTPVLMAASVLEADESLAAGHREEITLIRRHVELEARLIDDMLDLTRVARGKLSLHEEIVDAHALVREAINTCCPDEIGKKRLAVRMELSARRCHVRGDPARLQQVFWNLLKNAVKFTPEGGVVTVRTRDGEGGIIVEIADSGIGIEPEVLPRIFDAFEQGGGAITRSFGGLGLGLAISKAIVELHGGTIAAASEGSGCGAVFTVGLGVVDPPKAGERPPDERVAIGPLRILLVEDHESTARLMQRLLISAGHEVRVAHTLSAARDAASAGAFDLLISDVGLPDGSGLDLMREMGAAKRVKGIALSGYGMEEDIARSRSAGFDAHLTKPVDLRRLEAAIRQVIGGSDQAER